MDIDKLEAYLYAQRFYFLAEQCLNIMQKSLAGTLRRRRLTHTQHLILLVLRYAAFSRQDVISTDIAFLLGLEKHSITTVVDKLVASGLVVRQRSTADRRVIHIALTSKGADLAAEVQEETMLDIASIPESGESEFVHMCDFLPDLRAHIARLSGQPAESYSRAYEALLLRGQGAFQEALQGDSESPASPLPPFERNV